MGVCGQRHAPAALHPGKTRYPLYRRMAGPRGWPGRVRKISPPPGFDSRTFQSVASRYTDWAIQTPLSSLHLPTYPSNFPLTCYSLFFYLYMYLIAYISTHLSNFLSMYLSICLSIWLSTYLHICLFINLFICLIYLPVSSLNPFIYLFIYIFVFLSGLGFVF
jgi:hypothetical protein